MSDASLSGTNLTLTLADNRAIFPGRKMQVAYDNIFAADAVGLFMDDAGNALENFSAQEVTNSSGLPNKPPGEEVGPPIASVKVMVSETELTVAEGGSATYTVELSAKPEADVTVAISAYPSGALTVSHESLTFTGTTGTPRRR